MTLLQILELVASALGDNTPSVQIPIFNHFCFEKGRVYAYNYTTAVVAPLKTFTEDAIAVSGAPLLGFLRTTSDHAPDISFKSGSVILSVANTRISLPYLPKSEFLFEEPLAEDFHAGGVLSRQAVEAFGVCLETVSKDKSQVAHRGICARGNDLFSCDGDVITKVRASTINDGFLTSAFCQAILKVWSAIKPTEGSIYLGKGWVKAVIDEYTIYGRLPSISNPMNHQKVIDDTIGRDPVTYAQAPEGLIDALTRARVLADVENSKTHVSVRKGQLSLLTETSRGAIHDRLTFDHPDAEAWISAAKWQQALKHATELALCDACCVFINGGTTILVSNLG
jgi:hypothetical protein